MGTLLLGPGGLYSVFYLPCTACRESDLSLSGLDPVPLSKIGTRLLASLGSKGKNRNSCLPQKCRFPFRGEVL